jgi:hypothetical protein
LAILVIGLFSEEVEGRQQNCVGMIRLESRDQQLTIPPQAGERLPASAIQMILNKVYLRGPFFNVYVS